MTGHPFPDCPHVFIDGDGHPMFLDGRYWCQAWIDYGLSGRRRRCPEDCPPCFGPWGAWRSGYASVAAYADVEELGFGAIDEYFVMRHALRAVGWPM